MIFTLQPPPPLNCITAKSLPFPTSGGRAIPQSTRGFQADRFRSECSQWGRSLFSVCWTMSCLAQHPSHPIPCCLSLLCGLEHVPALLSASWCITRGFPSLSWLIPHPVTDPFLLRRVFIPASKRITFTSTLVKLQISVFENHFAKHFAFLSIQSDKYFVSTNLVPGIFTRSLCRR